MTFTDKEKGGGPINTRAIHTKLNSDLFVSYIKRYFTG